MSKIDSRETSRLREREALFEVLTESSYDLIRLHELDGRSIYANRAVMQLLGENPANLFDSFHPEDLANGRQWWQHILTGGRDRIEWRVRDAAGGWHWLESRASVVQYEGKRRVTTVCRDISERKQAEEALKESETKYRAFFQLSNDVILFADRDGNILDINPRAEQLTGYPQSDLLKMNVFQHLIVQEDQPVIRQVLRDIFEGQPRTYEERWRTRDGKIIYFEGSSVTGVSQDGEVLSSDCTLRDITDRKLAENALLESQQLLQLVLATLPVGVAVIDRAGDILLSNVASKIIWGDMLIVSGRRRWAQTKGSWHDSGKSIGPTEWASARALSEGKTSLNELIDIETYDGQRKTIQNSAAPIRNAEGAIVGAVFVNEDVTERVRAEEALRESAVRLQHLSHRLLAVQEEERRHLARELHDEFGQLLASITVQLHAARSAAGEAAQSILEECMALLQRAGAQVRSLALELRPAMLDTAGLDSTLRWLAEQHRQRTGVAVDVVGHLNDVPGNQAIAGFRMVQEALTNVVRHARAQHIWIELSQADGTVKLVVRDDGVGFDVTKTLAQAAARGHLGLLGMKERAQILGGSLEVDSEPGRGTRLRISLPVPESTAELAEPMA